MVSRLVLLAALATSGLIIYLLVQSLLLFPYRGLAVDGPSDSFTQQDHCNQAEKLLALLSRFVHNTCTYMLYVLLIKIYLGHCTY